MPIGYPHWSTIVFGLPFSGKNLPPQVMMSFKDIGAPMNTNMVTLHCFGEQIADARNNFAKEALRLNAKYLFFMDEDVSPPPYALRELFFQLEHHPDWGVIGGIYVLKTERPEPLVFRGRGTGPFWHWRVGEVFECTGIGMGCTLIRTDVLRDLKEPWFRTIHNLDKQLDNLRVGEVWTEDLWFCKEVVEKTKWKIVAHGQVICPHWDLNSGQKYELPLDSYPMRRFLPTGKKKIVDLGCGPNKFKTNEGTVVGCDLREFPGVDYRCDLRKLPFGTEAFDIVYSSHALEHFPRAETKAVLEEWTRILKKDGELRLVLPNLTWAVRNIKLIEKNPQIMDVFYGAQTYPLDFHKTGFTEGLIRAELTELGFKHIHITEQGLSLVVQAVRQKPKVKKCTTTKSSSKAVVRASPSTAPSKS